MDRRDPKVAEVGVRSRTRGYRRLGGEDRQQACSQAPRRHSRPQPGSLSASNAETLADPEPGPDAEFERMQEHELFGELVSEFAASLDEHDGRIVVLRFLRSWSFSEIARELNVSHACIRSVIHRLIAKLRDFLRRRGVGAGVEDDLHENERIERNSRTVRQSRAYRNIEASEIPQQKRHPRDLESGLVGGMPDKRVGSTDHASIWRECEVRQSLERPSHCWTPCPFCECPARVADPAVRVIVRVPRIHNSSLTRRVGVWILHPALFVRSPSARLIHCSPLAKVKAGLQFCESRRNPSTSSRTSRRSTLWPRLAGIRASVRAATWPPSRMDASDPKRETPPSRFIVKPQRSILTRT